MADIKILKSDWLNAFWFISDFSQIWNFAGTEHIAAQFQKKIYIMTKFYNNFKKPCFWLFLRQLFLQKIWSCYAQLHIAFYHHANIWQKLLFQLQENTRTEETTEDWTDGMTESGQAIIYRTFPANTRGPIICSILYTCCFLMTTQISQF